MQFVLQQRHKKILVDNGVCSVFAERMYSIFLFFYSTLEWWWWWLPEQQRTIYLIYLGCKARYDCFACQCFARHHRLLNQMCHTIYAHVWTTNPDWLPQLCEHIHNSTAIESFFFDCFDFHSFLICFRLPATRLCIQHFFLEHSINIRLMFWAE